MTVDGISDLRSCVHATLRYWRLARLHRLISTPNWCLSNFGCKVNDMTPGERNRPPRVHNRLITTHEHKAQLIKMQPTRRPTVNQLPTPCASELPRATLNTHIPESPTNTPPKPAAVALKWV
jgi:hypothetical protein